LVWDLKRAAELAPLVDEVADPSRRRLATRVIEDFEEQALPSLASLRAQVIHGDVQADNVVLDEGEPPQVAGIIDFGDLVHSPLVCALAVATACMSWGRAEPFLAAEAVIRGFSSVTRLEPLECELLPTLVGARLLAWVLIAAWRARAHPGNRD